MSLSALFFLFFFFLLCSFLFSGSETGLLTIPKFKVSFNARRGALADRFLLKIMEKKERFIIVLLIGNNIANIIITIIFLMIIRNLELISFLEAKNIPTFLAYALPSLLLTAFLMIFVEIYPKNIYRKYNYKIMKISVFPLILANFIFYIPAYLLHHLTLVIPFLNRPEAEEEKKLRTDSILLYIAREAARDGEILPRGDQLIQAIMDTERIAVKDIMFPISKFSKIQSDALIKDIKKIDKIEDAYYFPVFSGDIPLGAFYLFDIIDKNENDKIINYIKPMQRINSNMNLDEALLTFLNGDLMMALVQDKKSKILGIVSRTDILGKIFEAMKTES